MCHEQWALTVIKLLSFFVLIFAVFHQILYFFVLQWYIDPSFIKIVDVFDLYTPQNQNIYCGVNSNDHIPRKRFCSRGVAWTWAPKSRTNRSHRKRSYSISNIGNMMRCNHLSCVPVGPFADELWHFELSNNDRPPFRILTFNIWSRDCHCGPNMLLCTKLMEKT